MRYVKLSQKEVFWITWFSKEFLSNRKTIRPKVLTKMGAEDCVLAYLRLQYID